MKPVPYQLDDAIRFMAKEMIEDLSSSAAIKKNLGNSQIRKFWDHLKMERNSRFAWLLASHQRKKAEKEEKDERDPSRKTRAQARKEFWTGAQNIVDDTKFLQELRQKVGPQIEVENILELQIIFAEALYSEFLYRQ